MNNCSQPLNKHLFSPASVRYVDIWYAVSMCNDLICVYPAKWSPQWDQLTHPPPPQLPFFVVKTSKIYSLSNFQLYDTAFLTIVTMLYIMSQEFIHLITKSSYPLTTFFHCLHHALHHPSPWQPPIYSGSVSLDFLSFYTWVR